MGFHLKADDRVDLALRRIVKSQLKKAAREFSRHEPREEMVHQVRARLKRTRAALRLVRYELGSKAYRAENARLRKAAHHLREARDTEVRLATLRKLVACFPQQLRDEDLFPLIQALETEFAATHRRVLVKEKAPAHVRRLLKKTRKCCASLSFAHRDWKAIGPGIEHTFRQGREAYGAARREATTLRLHEWRKQTKYLMNQLKLFKALPGTRALTGELENLSDLLGEDHDLAMLRETVLLTGTLKDETANRLLALIDQRRLMLEQQAFAFGGRIYRRKPKSFRRELHEDWREWYRGAR